MKHIVIYVMTALVGISCSVQLPQAEVSTPKEWVYGEGFSRDSTSFGVKWWEIFSDTTLNRIMEHAVEQNRELKSSFTNLEQARSHVKIARSQYLPSLYLDVEGEGYRINGSTVQQYTAMPTLKWEISLFGAMKSTKRGAAMSFLATEWGYRAAILSLTAEVATTLFTYIEYKRSYEIAQRSYLLRREQTALVDSMHRYGMSDGIALERARSLVYSAESEIARYRRAMVETKLALNLLLGESPDVEILIDGLNPRLPQIPVGIPSRVLRRRCDVVQSYYTMRSAAAKVGVAHANRFPSISLTTAGGLLSYTLKDLSSSKPIGWSVTGAIAQPIFEFGALRRSEEIARQEYLAALYDYEQSTLQALSDVETALISISTLRSQLLCEESLVAANSKIEQTTSALYRGGMGDYLSVIDAQRELFASEISLQQSLAQQYINYVSLIKSLGGGW